MLRVADYLWQTNRTKQNVVLNCTVICLKFYLWTNNKKCQPINDFSCVYISKEQSYS